MKKIFNQVIKNNKKNDVIIPESKKPKILSLLEAVMIAFAITAIIFIGYAILITYTSIGEEHLTLIITTTSIISIAVSGFDVAKESESHGWLWGIIAGLIYALVLIMLGVFIANKIIFSTQTFALILLAAASGGVGGIIGINFKK